jgi:hypothetical protein
MQGLVSVELVGRGAGIDMVVVNKTINPAHSAMRMVGEAIQAKLPPGSQYVLIVYDDEHVVDRQVSFLTSDAQDVAVARIKEFVQVLDR